MNAEELTVAIERALAHAAAAAPAPADPAMEPGATAAPAPGVDAAVHALVHAYLFWEAGAEAASKAIRRLTAEVVDLNELRVCRPAEIVGLIGPKYPRAQERAERLTMTLADVFAREQATGLDHLAASAKRDVRAYLDSLDAVPPFVAARVALLRFGVHAFPLDARLTARLGQAGVCVGPETPQGPGAPEALAARLERVVRAGEAVAAYLTLERWDAIAPAVKAPRRGSSSPRAAGVAPSGQTTKTPKPTPKPSTANKGAAS